MRLAIAHENTFAEAYLSIDTTVVTTFGRAIIARDVISTPAAEDMTICK